MRSISIWHFAGLYILVTLVSFIYLPPEQRMHLDEPSNVFKVIDGLYSALYMLGLAWSGYNLRLSLKGQGCLTLFLALCLGWFCYALAALQTFGLEGSISETFWTYFSPETRYLWAYGCTLILFLTTYLFAWAAGELCRKRFPAKSIPSAALLIQFIQFSLMYTFAFFNFSLV